MRRNSTACRRRGNTTLQGVDLSDSSDFLANMDSGPWNLFYGREGELIGVQSEDFTHDVYLRVYGDFAPGGKGRYCERLARALNGG